MSTRFRIIFFLSIIHFFSSSYGSENEDSLKSLNLSNWAFEALNIPILDNALEKEIVIAVVDDGFMLSHNAFKGFIHTNDAEIPGNNIDDDHNGYIDDYQGWDVSDNDNNVNTTNSTKDSHYHGTFIASLVTQIIYDCYGERAKGKIRILPVKALSDHAPTTAITDGYLGIKYAAEMNVDIICTAWSGGIPSQEEKEIINKALQKNILILGSAGNTNKNTVDPPASTTGIYAIAALDTLLRKTKDSNYGMEIDLALPGEKVRAAHPAAKNAWFYGRGTSAAAGLAAGCAAVLKGLKPEASPREIMEALMNTTDPIDSINNSYCGKLGSGLPNLHLASTYLLEAEERSSFFRSDRPEGALYITGHNKRYQWDIDPWGAYHAIVLIPESIKTKDLKKTIFLRSADSIYYEGPIQGMIGGLSVPGSEVSIRFLSDQKKHLPSELKVNYHAETIDSTTIYCGGKVVVEAEKGTLSDNSGSANYANNCSCQWYIQASNSSRIKFDFDAFDTEAKVDFVWIFDGNSTNPENIIAKFSGSNIPPSVTSRTNSVTLWFVTNEQSTGKGWEVHYQGQQ